MKLLSGPLRYYVMLMVLYLALVLILPANHIAMLQYHLTANQYHGLLFAIVLPNVVIWYAAFFGYYKLRTYTRAITGAEEEAEFDSLTKGSTWLAWSLPISALVSIVLNSVANDMPDFHPTAIILSNYVNLLLPLVAFSIIGSGVRRLASTHGVRLSIGSARLMMLLFSVLGVMYCFLTFRHFDLQSISSNTNPYFLPIWLMLLTITIPYLYSWYIGLLAVFELLAYAYRSKGVFYRTALRYLGLGFVIVIASSIILQYISSVIPRTGHLSLNTTLIITYAVRFISAVGYVMIALGANRLRKIEEV